MADAVLLGNILHHFREAEYAGKAAELTDAQLLDRFIHQRDETAFAGLLRRHGPMVLNVCRHVLNHAQDIEDAFQAAFLVLVRRASSIRQHDSLASWLYGVALRTARRASLDAARRRVRERRTAIEPVFVARDDMTWNEVQEVLHEEIDQLPEIHRAPIVLCYLEGQTNARAARQLGVPAGSLSKRLGRARGLLRGRLLRRGVALPAGVLLALPLGQVSAAVPPALARATTRAAANALFGTTTAGLATILAESVAKGLMASRAKAIVGWLMAFGILVIGGSWLAVERGIAEPPRSEAKPPREPDRARGLPPAVAEEAPQKENQPELAAVTRRLLLRYGGNERSEAAVAAGLTWLAAQQKGDGRWSFDGGMMNDTAGTAFGLLPFLGTGSAHRGPLGKGPHAALIQKGLDFLVSKQAANGDLGGGMYGHALGTMTLCQAYALSADPKLKEPAQKAVDYIVKAQHAAGGWRYVPGTPGDVSVTAWQVAALHAARQGGLLVLAETLDRTHGFLNSCQTPEGGYGYVTPMATPTMTAAGLISRIHLGWDRHSAEFRAGVRELAKLPPGGANRAYYHLFWATQVFQRAGGAEWEKWNVQVRDFILSEQEQDKDQTRPQLKGSWTPVGGSIDSAGGRLMVTSLALLTLEVYYRDELPLAAAAARAAPKDDLQQAWSNLSATDDLTTRRAHWMLVKSPEKALLLLREQLPPRPPPGLDRPLIARLLADLDSDNFEKREQASAALEKMGRSVEVLMREARDKSKSAEVRRRLGELLAKLEQANLVPEPVRMARAVEVLEHVDTADARLFLRELAEQVPNSDLGREAKAALARLNARR